MNNTVGITEQRIRELAQILFFSKTQASAENVIERACMEARIGMASSDVEATALRQAYKRGLSTGVLMEREHIALTLGDALKEAGTDESILTLVAQLLETRVQAEEVPA